MDPDCRRLVNQEIKLQHAEFHLNLRLAKHCSHEATKHCFKVLEDANFKDFTSDGKVITCLARNVKNITNAECHAEVLRKVEQRVEMPHLDPVVQKECADDAELFCREHKSSPHQLTDCLKAHFDQLSPSCKTQQKIYMVAASSDIRVNSKLRGVCGEAREQHCKAVKPGTGRVVECLLAHMHDDDLDSSCREELVKEQQKRAKSIEYNPMMAESCRAEVDSLVKQSVCQPEGKGTGWMLLCLSKHVKQVKSMTCRASVFSLRRRYSADLRAVPGAELACAGDIAALCDDVAPGAGRLHQCLRLHEKSIRNPECRAKVLQVQAVDKYHAHTNFRVQQHCVNEMKAFCQDIQAGGSRMMACLGAHRKAAGFSEECVKSLATTAVGTGELRVPEMPTIRGELKRLLEDNRGTLERWGGILLTGTIGFVSVLAFALAYYIISRRYFGYNGMNKDLEYADER